MWNIWIDPRGGADIFPQEELSQLQTVGATGMARVSLPKNNNIFHSFLGIQ